MNSAKVEKAALNGNLTVRGVITAAAPERVGLTSALLSRCRVLTAATLSLACALAQPALAQGAGTAAAIPDAPAASTERFLADLEAAFGFSSEDAEALERDLDDARTELRLARRGLSAVGTLAPGVEHVNEPAAAPGAWEVELELDLTAAYRYDREEIIEAEIAVERAEGRLRAQRRDDLETALLALSDSRLSELAVQESRTELEEAQAELAEALQDGLGERELEALRIEVEAAAVELERELLGQREADATLAQLGLSEAGAANDGDRLTAPAGSRLATMAQKPAPLLDVADGGLPLTAPDLRLLSLELELAEHVLSLTPFEIARELELYGTYETAGLEAGARVALERGVPTAETTLGWELGDDDDALTFGIGATFRLSDASSRETKVAQSDAADARARLADYLAEWPQLERRERTLAELAYREFVLELRGLELSSAALEELEAAGSDGREMDTARNSVRRALGSSERAWQRYVRELCDYLDVLDVVLIRD